VQLNSVGALVKISLGPESRALLNKYTIDSIDFEGVGYYQDLLIGTYYFTNSIVYNDTIQYLKANFKLIELTDIHKRIDNIITSAPTELSLDVSKSIFPPKL